MKHKSREIKIKNYIISDTYSKVGNLNAFRKCSQIYSFESIEKLDTAKKLEIKESNNLQCHSPRTKIHLIYGSHKNIMS